MNPASLYIEIGQSSFKVLYGEEGLEIAIERAENGHLTPESKTKLTTALQGFLKRQPWQTSRKTYCAIGARGVSLRVLSLPVSNKDEVSQLLHLQIENEFPLPPDHLAWGYRILDHAEPTTGTPKQEVLIAVIKKDTLKEYTNILTNVGIVPIFTVAAVVRSAVCPQPPASYSIMEIGSMQSELITFENGAPLSLRILSWGSEDITKLIQERLSISRDQAELLKIEYGKSGANGQSTVGVAITSALETFAGTLDAKWLGSKVYLMGKGARCKGIAPKLSKALGGTECERVELPQVDGHTGAILGLKHIVEKDPQFPQIILQGHQAKPVEPIRKPVPWRWAGVAALIIAGLIAIPCVEALVRKPILANRINLIKANTNRLDTIDRELAFLQNLKKSQPPYIEVLQAIAYALPHGTGARIDSFVMGRRGDISFRGSLRDGQQVNDFRTKLLSSGAFNFITVDEQIPSADRQKVNIRVTAQWKTDKAREVLTTLEDAMLKAAAKNAPAKTPDATVKTAVKTASK